MPSASGLIGDTFEMLFVRDVDADDDGVHDADDACPGTAPASVIDANGCTVTELCPLDGGWRNHGEYVSCVAQAAQGFVRQGLITADTKAALVRAAARSR